MQESMQVSVGPSFLARPEFVAQEEWSGNQPEVIIPKRCTYDYSNVNSIHVCYLI